MSNLPDDLDNVLDYINKNKDESGDWDNPNGRETRDMLKRRRFRLDKLNLTPEYWGTDARTCLELYLNMLDEKNKNILLSVFKYVGLFNIRSQKVLKSAYKMISEAFFADGGDIEEYKLFVGLQTLFDYEKEEEGIINETIEKWFMLGDTYLDKTTLNRNVWLSNFRESVRHVITTNIRLNDEFIPTDDFLKQGGYLNFGKVGASRYYDDKTLAHSKWQTVLDMDYEDAVKIVNDFETHTSSIFIKREPAKQRGVAMCDFKFYFISELFLRAFNLGNDDSVLTLGNSSKRQLLDFLEDIDNMDGTTCFVPIDQSEFDRQISLEMMEILYDELYQFAILSPKIGKDELYSQVFKDMIKGVYNHYVINEEGKVLLTKKGMPSGIGMTALNDSLISAALAYMVKKLAGIDFSFKTLGDDVKPRLKDAYDAKSCLDAYAMLGVTTNSKKTYASVKRNEYLRKVMEEDGIHGYPARMVHTLCFSNPANFVKPGEESVDSIIDNWVAIHLRGCKNNFDFMVLDIYNAFFKKNVDNNKQYKNYNAFRQDFIQYLWTDREYGGAGFNGLFNDYRPKSNRKVGLKMEQMELTVKQMEVLDYVKQKFANYDLDDGILYHLAKIKMKFDFRLDTVINNLNINTKIDPNRTIKVVDDVMYYARRVDRNISDEKFYLSIKYNDEKKVMLILDYGKIFNECLLALGDNDKYFKSIEDKYDVKIKYDSILDVDRLTCHVIRNLLKSNYGYWNYNSSFIKNASTIVLKDVYIKIIYCLQRSFKMITNSVARYVSLLLSRLTETVMFHFSKNLKILI